MNKSGLFIMLLIIIGFLVLQHRTIPNIPVPPASHAAGQNLEIPVAMRFDTSKPEVWTLSRRADEDQYFASVYVNERLVRQFATTKLLGQDGGRTYATTGQIRVAGVLYQATRIHVNPDGRTGYITLTRVNEPAGGAHTSASAGAPSS